MKLLGHGTSGALVESAPPTICQIAGWLELFVEPDQVVGLVAFHVGRPNRTHAGYFDGRHLGRMANFAVALGRKAGGVYFTLNPVRPELLARRPNNAYATAGRDWMPLTADADIASRSYVLVDVDPVRPAESRGASATDAERAAAWSVAADVVSLTNAGG